jgi:hypothetical protein
MTGFSRLPAQSSLLLEKICGKCQMALLAAVPTVQTDKRPAVYIVCEGERESIRAGV